MIPYGKDKKAGPARKKPGVKGGGMKGVLADHFRNKRFKKGKKK